MIQYRSKTTVKQGSLGLNFGTCIQFVVMVKVSGKYFFFNLGQRQLRQKPCE